MKALKRVQKVLEEQIDRIPKEKVRIQKIRIGNGDEVTSVRTWNLEREGKFTHFYAVVDVQTSVANLWEGLLKKVRKDEENLEKEKRKWHYDEEIKLEEAKLEIKREFEKKMGEARRK